VGRQRQAKLAGICSGIVAGLVAITPAAGFVGVGVQWRSAQPQQ